MKITRLLSWTIPFVILYILTGCNRNLYYEANYSSNIFGFSDTALCSIFGVHQQKCDSQIILYPCSLYLNPAPYYIEKDTEVVRYHDPTTMEFMWAETLYTKKFNGARYFSVQVSQYRNEPVAIKSTGAKCSVRTSTGCTYNYLSWDVRDTTEIPPMFDSSFCWAQMHHTGMFCSYTGRDSFITVGGEIRRVSIFTGAHQNDLRHFGNPGFVQQYGVEVIYIDKILKIPILVEIFTPQHSLNQEISRSTVEVTQIRTFDKRSYYRELHRRSITKVPDTITAADSSLYRFNIPRADGN